MISTLDAVRPGRLAAKPTLPPPRAYTTSVGTAQTSFGRTTDAAAAAAAAAADAPALVGDRCHPRTGHAWRRPKNNRIRRCCMALPAGRARAPMLARAGIPQHIKKTRSVSTTESPISNLINLIELTINYAALPRMERVLRRYKKLIMDIET